MSARGSLRDRVEAQRRKFRHDGRGPRDRVGLIIVVDDLGEGLAPEWLGLPPRQPLDVRRIAALDKVDGSEMMVLRVKQRTELAQIVEGQLLIDVLAERADNGPVLAG